MFPSHIQKKNHADPSQISFYSCSDCRLGGIPYTQHPEWKNKEPFASLLRGDLKAALEGGDHGPMEHFMATHTGMTTDEFALMVKGWMATAKHPQTGKRFLDMTYQPMLCETAKAVLVRLPALNFNDDKDDKPVGINQHIGRRPIVAFGNSDPLQLLLTSPEQARRHERGTWVQQGL